MQIGGVVDLDNQLSSDWVNVGLGHGHSGAFGETDHRGHVGGPVVQSHQRFNRQNSVGKRHRIFCGGLISSVQGNCNTAIVAAYTWSRRRPICTHIIFFNSTGRAAPVLISEVTVIARQVKQNAISAYLIASQRVVGHEVTRAANHQGFRSGADRESNGGGGGEVEDGGVDQESAEVGGESKGPALEVVQQEVGNVEHSAGVFAHGSVLLEDGVVGRGQEVVPAYVALGESAGGRGKPEPKSNSVAYHALHLLAHKCQTNSAGKVT